MVEPSSVPVGSVPLQLYFFALDLRAVVDVDCVASALRPLHISTSTLYDMLRYDLFPILYPNLMCVAGVWDAFDDVWLLSQIEAQRAAGPGWAQCLLHWVAWLTIGQAVAEPWDQVKNILQR